MRAWVIQRYNGLYLAVGLNVIWLGFYWCADRKNAISFAARADAEHTAEALRWVAPGLFEGTPDKAPDFLSQVRAIERDAKP